MSEHGCVMREDIREAYIDMQIQYLSRITNKPKDELRNIVVDIVNSNTKVPNMVVAKTISPGNVSIVKDNLIRFSKDISNKVVAPSGSIYKPQYEAKSILSQMLIDKMAERSKIKKLQLKAANDGDKVMEETCWFKQAKIKISCNSLPGGMGSQYNIFYDKGGYNTITSTARCMIARAYTIGEQLLGGNFAWFSVDELINFIILNLNYMPSSEMIEKTIKKYKLRYPTKEELLSFYTETLHTYRPTSDMTKIDVLLSKLNNIEITFLYYYCNLRHLMWTNTSFKNYIDFLFDTKEIVVDPDVTTEQLFVYDETIIVLCTVAFHNELDECGLADIISERKDLLPMLVALCKQTKRRLAILDDLFSTFINTDADMPEINKKPFTRRNTVIISDTDSVIFTATAWDDWYRDGKFDIDTKSYQINALVVYWLHHTVKFALKRFSIAYGVTGNEINRLAMKNEFLYPIMLLYDNKKTYAGIQKVQEGVVFKDPKPDIKGQTLKGSSISPSSLEFIKDMITYDILYKVMKEKINVFDLIDKVIAFENKIKLSLENGETEFLKITSLKFAKDYKNPDSVSVNVAWEFWQEVFMNKYGEIRPPIKTVFFPIIQPKQSYYDELKKSSPSIYKKLAVYLGRQKKLPNNIIINPILDKVPKELISLIDIRSVIKHNLQPIYNTLGNLNISVGGDNHKILLSDIY